MLWVTVKFKDYLLLENSLNITIGLGSSIWALVAPIDYNVKAYILLNSISSAYGILKSMTLMWAM